MPKDGAIAASTDNWNFLFFIWMNQPEGVREFGYPCFYSGEYRFRFRQTVKAIAIISIYWYGASEF
jgi:hypothetical protein